MPEFFFFNLRYTDWEENKKVEIVIKSFKVTEISNNMDRAKDVTIYEYEVTHCANNESSNNINSIVTINDVQ